jgi:hypothetical protein
LPIELSSRLLHRERANLIGEHAKETSITAVKMTKSLEIRR